jgi:hypothetical protein
LKRISFQNAKTKHHKAKSFPSVAWEKYRLPGSPKIIATVQQPSKKEKTPKRHGPCAED